MNYYFIVIIAAFLLSLILGKVAIPCLVRMKAGQSIREEGPSWHQSKAGTPTMGGIIFIASIILSLTLVFILNKEVDALSLAVIICALLYGLIGFVDDYIKVVKKRNLGLTSSQKFAAQLLVAIAFVLYTWASSLVSDSVIIPFYSGVSFSYFFMPFAVFVLLAVVNSVNLTDGIDGLASSVSIVCIAFFASCAFYFGLSNLSLLLFGAVGALIGFLFYNWHPAKVFMGDTGSLFLGGLIGAGAIAMGLEFFFLLSGFIFLLETVSVVLQVLSFKLTGKRIFKMAPIHHHFEKCGWSEVKIVAIFSLVTLLLSFAAWIILN